MAGSGKRRRRKRRGGGGGSASAGGGGGGGALSRVRIPPWLFWTLVSLFALAVLSLMMWAAFQPAQP